MSKESGLRIRVDQELRVAFLKACKSLDRTASQEIRNFMRQYVNQSETQAQPSLFSGSIEKDLDN